MLKEGKPKDLMSEMVKILENQDIEWEAKLHLLEDILKATEAEHANRLSEILKIISDRYFQWIELTVDHIDPSPVWPFQSVTVQFSLVNHSSRTTSGYVTGDVTQELIHQVLESGPRSQKSARVNDLAPGQKVQGTLQLQHWRDIMSIAPGLCDLNLYYWVVVANDDPNVSISVVQQGPDGQQNVVSFGCLASGSDTLVQLGVNSSMVYTVKAFPW